MSTQQAIQQEAEESPSSEESPGRGDRQEFRNDLEVDDIYWFRFVSLAHRSGIL